MASTIDRILGAAPNVPNFAASNQLAIAGGNQVVSGLDTLRKLAVGQGALNASNQQAEVERNTQAAISRLNEFKKPDDFNAQEFISGLTGEFGKNIDLAQINKAVAGVPEQQFLQARTEDYFKNNALETEATDTFNKFIKDAGPLAGINQLNTLDDLSIYSKENNLSPEVAAAVHSKLVNKMKEELAFVPKVNTTKGGGTGEVKSKYLNSLANKLQTSITQGITTPENFVATREQQYAAAARQAREQNGVELSYNDYVEATRNIEENMKVAYNVANDAEAKNILDTGNAQIDTQKQRVDAAYNNQLEQIARSTKNADGNSYNPTYDFDGLNTESAISAIIPDIVGDNTTNQTQAFIAKQVGDVKNALVKFGVPRDQVTDSMVKHIFTSTGTDTQYLGRNGYNKETLTDIAKNVAGQIKVNNSLRDTYLAEKAKVDAEYEGIGAQLEATKNRFHKVLSGEYGKRSLGLPFAGYSTPDLSVVSEKVIPFVSKSPDVVIADKETAAKADSLKKLSNKQKELTEEIKDIDTVLKRGGSASGRAINSLTFNADSSKSLQEKRAKLVRDLQKLQKQ